MPNYLFPHLRAVRGGVTLGGVLALISFPMPALSASAASVEGTEAQTAGAPFPWELVVKWLTTERDRFAADLEHAHAALLARAKVEDPPLAERLIKAPVQRPSGYGTLPELLPDKPLGESTARRQLYSLETLSTAYAADLRDAAILALEAEQTSERALEPMVERLERLEKRLENLEDHLGYHENWQQSVIDHRIFFDRKNEILPLVEEWHTLEKGGEDRERSALLRDRIAARVAPFHATKGLAIEARPGGALALPVRVLTDIEDAGFLGAFQEAVRAAYSESPAARERRFSVELTLQEVSPQSLYPEGAPERGAKIKDKSHVGRFPAGALVLTTGATSTHAFTGRAIVLGSAAIPRRTLAHEFGHLLGFTDGYLRAYKGDPGDRYGVVLVEWKNLLEGLMGAPSRGRVTPGMIDRLIAGYGPAKPQGP